MEIFYFVNGLLIIGTDNGMATFKESISDENEIKEVVINDGVTYIAEEAFAECGNLINVTIPDTVINHELLYIN